MLLLLSVLVTALSSAQDRSHRDINRRSNAPYRRRRLQARFGRSADRSVQAHLRHDSLQRPRQRRHLRHRLQEPDPAGAPGAPVGDQPAAVVASLPPRRDGRLRQLRRPERQPHRQRLSLRRQEHAVPAGARQAVQRRRQRRLRPPDRPPLRRRDHLPPRRRHHRHRRNQDLLRQDQTAATKRSGRWTTTAPTSTPITHLGTISISPRISPDNSPPRLLLARHRRLPDRMYSLLLGRMVNFAGAGGTNISPAWAPDGKQYRLLLLAHRRPRDLDLRRQRQSAPAASPASAAPTSRPSATPRPAPDRLDQRPHRPAAALHHGHRRLRRAAPHRRRLRHLALMVAQRPVPRLRLGPQVRPRRSRRTGHLRDGGRHQERWIQLTHDGGRCDFPSWSPDGRHIVYANSADGKAAPHEDLTMLADGTQKRALTGPGADMPNWSWK